MGSFTLFNHTVWYDPISDPSPLSFPDTLNLAEDDQQLCVLQDIFKCVSQVPSSEPLRSVRKGVKEALRHPGGEGLFCGSQ